MATRDVIEVLGGRKVLREKIANPLELHEKTRQGFPYAAFDSVRSTLRLTRGEAARAIGVPERTVARRKKEKRFNALESDRLLRIARVGALAVEILGNEDNASQWLKKANYALGARPPLDLLDTDAGTKSVEDVLWQIAYGIVS